MESRIAHFRTLSENPWYNVMNWVIDEMRIPAHEKIYRWNHAYEGHAFYNIDRRLLRKAYKVKPRPHPLDEEARATKIEVHVAP